MSAEAVKLAESDVVDIVEFGPAADLSAAGTRAEVRDILERGDVVFLPDRGFKITERERTVITDPKLVERGSRGQGNRNGRPTLTFDPATDRLLFTTIGAEARRTVEAMLRRYAVWARELLEELAPDFAAAAEQNRIIYRPVERHKVQGLHVDSSYRHPTQGRSKLRIFCNIDPAGRPREWEVGERFEALVSRYLPQAKGRRSWSETATERLARMLGYLEGERSDYDHLLEDIRRMMKDDRDYQKNAPRRVFSFPAGSTWVGLTDVVLHGGLSGQHSLDEVFLLPPSALSDPSRSALSILERLSGRNLKGGLR
jgi:hypothetical protein